MFVRMTVLLCCASMAAIPTSAIALETKATSALIVDHGTGMVLFSEERGRTAPTGLDVEAHDPLHAF